MRGVSHLDAQAIIIIIIIIIILHTAHLPSHGIRPPPLAVLLALSLPL